MKPTILALVIGSVLVAASVGSLALAGAGGDDNHDHASHSHTGTEHAHAGADEGAVEHGMAGDHSHAQLGMHRPAFAPAEGRTPTADTAQNLEQVSSIRIAGDEDFTPAAGIREGNGTLDDPYIISGFYVTGDLYVQDTDACFIVRENYIGGQLSLNWNGQCTHVHHNYIQDLRVNENIRREGYATGGLLELNKIAYVGQLRHYDGEFRNNIVGPFTQQDIFDPVEETVPWLFGSDPRVANVDGFNQGLIHSNTFYGSVDLDLHGHHHGTGFFADHSHYHGDMEGKGMEHDHTDRWTSVRFYDNKIVDYEGYGLRYDDRNHAGDDRLANSEQEETLELDHKHHTDIQITGNEVEGAQIWIDVFNADDSNHYTRNDGWLTVDENTVHLKERANDGFLGTPFITMGTSLDRAIYVNTAKEVELSLQRNVITFEESDGSDGLDLYPLDDNQELITSGIYLERLKDANVVIADNTIEGFHYGVHARMFEADANWFVGGNEFTGAAYDVYYDNTVESKPTGPQA